MLGICKVQYDYMLFIFLTFTSLATLLSLLSMPCACKLMFSVCREVNVPTFQESQLMSHSCISSQITSK